RNAGYSGIEFLRAKFRQSYDRTANAEKSKIGDVQVNMDRDNLLLPIFSGMDQDNVKLFSAPKKMTVHHEIGHVNSMLEGKSGSKKVNIRLTRHQFVSQNKFSLPDNITPSSYSKPPLF
ncbi:MAG: hypothetical protein GY849_19540, partial [Deltaproteobacteria bacterium]|nr:hypothetical protein [Deltaproteobacteria bacterium]